MDIMINVGDIFENHNGWQRKIWRVVPDELLNNLKKVRVYYMARFNEDEEFRLDRFATCQEGHMRKWGQFIGNEPVVEAPSYSHFA